MFLLLPCRPPQEARRTGHRRAVAPARAARGARPQDARAAAREAVHLLREAPARAVPAGRARALAPAGPERRADNALGDRGCGRRHRALAGGASEAPAPEFGAANITLVNGGGKIFADTPNTQVVWESHNDEVNVLPEGFFITASSESCEIQGMENENGDRFGLQFHPEVNDSEYGQQMFQNFIEICKNSRKDS